MHKLLFTTAVLALLCGFSCRKEHDVNKLENTTWRLKKLVDGHAGESVPNDVVITAIFKAEQLTGKSACNTYLSTYVTTGDQISITLLSATLVGCPGNTWEDRYFAALRGSQSWGLDGSTLTIQCADASLLFKKQ